MSRIFVPLDDRPCTRDFPLLLAPLVGWDLELPPARHLGHATSPGAPDALLAWLDKQEASGGGLLSIDMLLSGGLVASRSLDLEAQPIATRAARLGRWLKTHPGGLFAFNVLMRVPPYCTSDDERRFSEKLMRYSQLIARAHAGSRNPVTHLRLRQVERTLPRRFLERYRRARERNHRINLQFLQWIREGSLDYGVIGMDDSRTEGFNVLERHELEPLLPPHGDLMPGADEVALVLMARAALHQLGHKLRLEVRYSPTALPQRVTRYEDRTVEQLIEAHRRVIGLQASSAGRRADIVLYVFGTSHAQQEASVQLWPPRVSERIRSFVRDIAADVERDRVVAVADLGYANGADRALSHALVNHVELPRLGAYAAWNTAGNTVGTALAHAVLRWISLRHPPASVSAPTAAAAHARFIYERLVDDWLYQSEVRGEVGLQCALKRVNIYDLGKSHGHWEKQVKERLLPPALDLWARAFAGRVVTGPHGHHYRLGKQVELDVKLPWARLFEVEVAATFGVRHASG